MNKLIIIAGPTAVGKSTYAIELAKKINGSIISADSIQVYKGLNIGSAKITKDEMDNVKHYLIDVVPFDYDFNITTFKQMAKKAIKEIYNDGKIPIIVGGTGFYIQAILYDINFKKENSIRKEEIEKLIYKIKNYKGIEFLYDNLKVVDIESYNKIHIHNEKRVIRALEYYMLHNEQISKHNEEESNKKSQFDYEYYALYCDKEVLYDRINKRIDLMINNGLLLEIKNLILNGCKKEYRSMQAIGYKELYDYVNNNINSIEKINYTNIDSELSNIINTIKQKSRNYAKRQMTWFRREENAKFIKIKY
ncbi:MAG: tRNA (adenosine(37)-N6)-dimethylallyltransferase MiaA [Eubacteriales bacterium]|nr:tRNA (adenosine(37)-N6)-dimethylallyltransferase MiaA [Eubacteriales bacterium]